MRKILEEILQELRQAKIDSLGTYRGGDYRIGLTKSEDIVNDKLHMHIVSRSLINKESLILVLKDKIIKRKLLYGTMQTEQEVNTYIDGFIDCMKAINKY